MAPTRVAIAAAAAAVLLAASAVDAQMNLLDNTNNLANGGVFSGNYRTLAAGDSRGWAFTVATNSAVNLTRLDVALCDSAPGPATVNVVLTASSSSSGGSYAYMGAPVYANASFNVNIPNCTTAAAFTTFMLPPGFLAPSWSSAASFALFIYNPMNVPSGATNNTITFLPLASDMMPSVVSPISTFLGLCNTANAGQFWMTGVTAPFGAVRLQGTSGSPPTPTPTPTTTPTATNTPSNTATASVSPSPYFDGQPVMVLAPPTPGGAPAPTTFYGTEWAGWSFRMYSDSRLTLGSLEIALAHNQSAAQANVISGGSDGTITMPLALFLYRVTLNTANPSASYITYQSLPVANTTVLVTVPDAGAAVRGGFSSSIPLPPSFLCDSTVSKAWALVWMPLAPFNVSVLVGAAVSSVTYPAAGRDIAVLNYPTSTTRGMTFGTQASLFGNIVRVNGTWNRLLPSSDPTMSPTPTNTMSVSGTPMVTPSGSQMPAAGTASGTPSRTPSRSPVPLFNSQLVFQLLVRPAAAGASFAGLGASSSAFSTILPSALASDIIAAFIVNGGGTLVRQAMTVSCGASSAFPDSWTAFVYAPIEDGLGSFAAGNKTALMARLFANNGGSRVLASTAIAVANILSGSPTAPAVGLNVSFLTAPFNDFLSPNAYWASATPQPLSPPAQIALSFRLSGVSAAKLNATAAKAALIASVQGDVANLFLRRGVIVAPSSIQVIITFSAGMRRDLLLAAAARSLQSDSVSVAVIAPVDSSVAAAGSVANSLATDLSTPANVQASLPVALAVAAVQSNVSVSAVTAVVASQPAAAAYVAPSPTAGAACSGFGCPTVTVSAVPSTPLSLVTLTVRFSGVSTAALSSVGSAAQINFIASLKQDAILLAALSGLTGFSDAGVSLTFSSTLRRALAAPADPGAAQARARALQSLGSVSAALSFSSYSTLSSANSAAASMASALSTPAGIRSAFSLSIASAASYSGVNASSVTATITSQPSAADYPSSLAAVAAGLALGIIIAIVIGALCLVGCIIGTLVCICCGAACACRAAARGPSVKSGTTITVTATANGSGGPDGMVTNPIMQSGGLQMTPVPGKTV